MRAERRHHKDRKIAAQLRILEAGPWREYIGHRDGRILDAHINCKCMGVREWMRREDRRRERLAWQAENAAY